MVEDVTEMRQNPELDALLTKHEEAFAEIYSKDQVRLQTQKAAEDFRCDSMRPSREPPTSVHMLRPADVNVIGALGDSLTAGNGARARTILGVLQEDRGRVFSIGGDRSYPDQTTLPKFVESYNSNLYGSSEDTSGRFNDKSGLNVGEPGDEANNMPEQARMLIDRMRADSNVDYFNDWKLVTLFIGGNDLCTYCTDYEFYSPEQHRTFIQTALDMLHDEMPRALVNILPIFDMQHISDLGNGFSCALVHRSVCPCKPQDPEEIREVSEYSLAYQDVVEDLIASGRYDTKTDFTVVVQPMFKKTTPPVLDNRNYDYSYWAPDCFHFSAKGHNTAGYNLWNNMLEPVGGKREEWDPTLTEFLCTTEQQPFIATNLNSRNGEWLPWDQIPQ